MHSTYLEKCNEFDYDCGYVDMINKTIDKYETRFNQNESQFNRFTRIEHQFCESITTDNHLPSLSSLPFEEEMISMAKKVKHLADRESDVTSKIRNYLQSAYYFIVAANTIECKRYSNDCRTHSTHSTRDRKYETLYRDTLNFVRYVTDNFAKTRSENEAYVPIIDNKLITISYRCQSLLFLKLTQIQSKVIRDNNKTIERMVRDLPQNTFNTNSLVSVMKRQLNLLNQYNIAHNLWSEADNITDKHSTCKEFFKLLDQECGVLCLNSNFDHLVNYVKTALQIMRKSAISLVVCGDYISLARQTKHLADCETDRTAQVCKYLEAMLYFILTANYMEQTTSDSEKVRLMHKETLSLLRNITARFIKCRPLLEAEIPKTDNQLIALIYRCETLLYLKLIASKTIEINKNSTAIQHQIHDLTLNNSQTHACVSIMQKQLALLHQYYSAHQLWRKTDHFIAKYQSCETFFDSLDHECGYLNIGSTLEKLLDYMKTALQTIS